ncbi:hypothetical protein [Mycobacterium sp.]|nr:hypothetical protein [Mycobacterium sp.]HME50075.1 hypothetical protein [Mycobacterium sp.]
MPKPDTGHPDLRTVLTPAAATGAARLARFPPGDVSMNTIRPN